MKRLILALALVLIPLIAKADTFSSPIIDALNGTLKSLPGTVGVVYCVREHQAKELTSVNILKYQDPKIWWLRLNGDVGYGASDLYMLEVMYPIDLNKLHITIPVLSQIDLSVGYAYGWLTDDTSRARDGGPAITASWKF